MPAARLARDAAAFCAAQSVYSDPDGLGRLYVGLPDDRSQLACVVRDLMVHRLEGEPFGHVIPQARPHNDAETRYLDDILRIIVERNVAPLTQRREVGDRFVGVSFLRHAGIPARLRSGFADYLGPDGFHGDHMVTEYWDDERGRLLADLQPAGPAALWSRARHGGPSGRAKRTPGPSDSILRRWGRRSGSGSWHTTSASTSRR
ncbi:hypothetical protein [Streptomyces sp. NPDC050264]|uniref:hypothetical protein n=1 Tax=Streptomyces sp. NPDC050264 TaxID=3155038 RepID=UPI0034421B1E